MKLEDCINFLLTGAQHRVFQITKKSLECYDLTPIQYGVLKCIWELDMHSPKEIAQYHGIDNSTISGILDRMENKGLIFRVIDDNDRRYIRIHPTKKADELKPLVMQAIDEANKTALMDFMPEEQIRLKKDLQRLMHTPVD